MELYNTLSGFKKFSPLKWVKYILPKMCNNCNICYKKLYNNFEYFLCMECKNVYHYKCMNTWFNENENLPCPLCRCNDKWHYFGS